VHLARVGPETWLWGRDRELVATMAVERQNAVYLPGIVFPDGLSLTTDLLRALDGTDFVVSAVPSHGTRAVLRDGARYFRGDAVVVSATKGLEQESLLRPTEVITEELGGRVRTAVLSGPSFASELARQLPTAVSVASLDPSVVAAVQAEFRAPYLRLYGTDDVTGVELGGALKNVIAIAAGVTEGLDLGHNALAGLVTRGLAEMSRLACAAGAKRETLAGLTGLGDLVLTCTGRLSRNRHVGVELGRGRPLDGILGGMRMVAEGVRTADAALALAARYNVEVPIAARVAAVLAGRQEPRAALEELMLRPQRAEVG
jgi:glycerol-3-phosphate dehydrogenase (NAD(P)+)